MQEPPLAAPYWWVPQELGAALVADPRVKALGFTGSRAGGSALAHEALAQAATEALAECPPQQMQ